MSVERKDGVQKGRKDYHSEAKSRFLSGTRLCGFTQAIRFILFIELKFN
jgi:hypothetical protein